jgi:hypothetical protein
VISGIPTTAGLSTVTVRVTDAVAVTATRVLTINTVNLNPDIITTSLRLGVTGTAYVDTVAATAGTPPYTWAITSGTLPTGITMSSTGMFTGTPTVVGTSTLGIRVTDAAARTDTVSLDLQVAEAVTITSAAALPSGVKDDAYTYTFTATGGVGPYVWTLGDIPAPGQDPFNPDGITLATSGVYSGIPTESGTFAFTVVATDTLGVIESMVVTLDITRLMRRPLPGESLATFPGLIDQIEDFLEADAAIVASGAIGSAVVTEGATTLTLTAAFTQPDTAYQAVFEPSWQTTTVAATKTATGLTVSFGVPVPTGGGIVWWRLRR